MAARSLRFRLSGLFMAACLYTMPRSRQKTLLVDALDRWMEATALELTGESLNLTIHQRFR